MKRTRFACLILVVLVLGSAAGADPAGSNEITAPPGFTFADAHLDEHGNGYLLWKDVAGLRTVIERFAGLERVQIWRLEGYVAKGFRAVPGRILLQGQDADGPRLRVVETGAADLQVTWDSREDLPEDLQVSDISVSGDLGWWYAAEYGATTATVRAGRLHEDEARFRWVVDVLHPDGFMASLADLSAPDGLRLALAVNGQGWLLAPASNQPLALEKPPECSEIFTVTGSRDGFWATCGGGVRVLYPAAPPGETPEGAPQLVDFLAVLDAANLRILPDGTTVVYERKPPRAEHSRSGTLQILRWNDGDLVASAAVPYPVPLGEIGHLAGSMVLLRVGGEQGGKPEPVERYRLLPLNLPRGTVSSP